jgi:probable phosphoglycerate mutase
MEIVRRGLELDPAGYVTDARLMEIDFGAWNGAVIEDLSHRFPDLAAERLAMPWTFVPPDGESYEQLFARVDSWVKEIAGPTIVVAHGGVSRVLRGGVIGLTPDEMMKLNVPQDRIFEVRHGGEEML